MSNVEGMTNVELRIGVMRRLGRAPWGAQAASLQVWAACLDRAKSHMSS
jgi:hypothetical protein